MVLLDNQFTMHTNVKILNRQMETNVPIAEERSWGGFAAQKCYVK